MTKTRKIWIFHFLHIKRKWAHKTEIRQERWHLTKAASWKIIDDSYAFSNAIRLIVFLITGKLIKFYQHVFCFFKLWFRIGQYDPFHTIIDNFNHVFKEFCFLWVLSPRIWNALWMCFSKMIFFHQIEKWRDDPEIPKKLFSVLFFGWKYAKSKHMGLSF